MTNEEAQRVVERAWPHMACAVQIGLAAHSEQVAMVALYTTSTKPFKGYLLSHSGIYVAPYERIHTDCRGELLAWLKEQGCELDEPIPFDRVE